MTARRWSGLLVLLLLIVPVVEIWVIVQVGQGIGVGWTVLLLVASGVIGSWLITREGSKAWRALRTSLDEGRMPARELADGVLVVLGGALMLSPGFVTDAVGLLLVLPFTRPIARAAFTAVLARRLVVTTTARRPGPPADGAVVQGEVVD